MKVIIFEDNYITALSLELMVQEIGGQVVDTFDSADDLSSIMQGKAVDCILMDIQLAGEKTGLEATDEIRKASEVPVIFLSGNNQHEVIRSIESMKNTSFITKPYTETHLRNKLVSLGLVKEQ
ncbi:MAG: response regulator [Ekhidna sp.]|nr:response regulator [Ekhidna sp.]